MPRAPSTISEICIPQESWLGISLEHVDSCILFDGFVVCVEWNVMRSELSVFDRITSKKLSILQFEFGGYVDYLVRSHNNNWSVGFCIYNLGKQEEDCYFYPISINKYGIMESHTPILLLSTPYFLHEVIFLTSLDEYNTATMMIGVRNETRVCFQVYDISGAKVFPVSCEPNFTIEEGKPCLLAGRMLWAEPYGYVAEREFKSYDLSTGAVLRSIHFDCWESVFCWNRFIISKDSESSLCVVDTVSEEKIVYESFWPPLSLSVKFHDFSDDGLLLFTDKGTLKTLRFAVQSLSDIAKEHIHELDLAHKLVDDYGVDSRESEQYQIQVSAAVPSAIDSKKRQIQEQEDEIPSDSEDDIPSAKRHRNQSESE